LIAIDLKKRHGYQFKILNHKTALGTAATRAPEMGKAALEDFHNCVIIFLFFLHIYKSKYRFIDYQYQTTACYSHRSIGIHLRKSPF
jgi:hypothetical protein